VQHRTLLLDRNYMALSLVPWRKAIKLMVNGKAEAVPGVDSVGAIRGQQQKYEIPSIIRLLVVIPWRAHIGRTRFSRKNVLIRDSHTCQYCGIRVGKNASIDHVMPRSRGGKTNYLNCVTCCKDCNNVKADRTPEEAKMELAQKPRKPSFTALYRHYLNNPPDEWCDYIIGLKAEK
jgi:5-methylcytosine-specific restriction endonuclease McrA